MANHRTQKSLENAVYKKLTKIVRAGAIQCFQNIVIGSPVDTGRFRMNWQASVNTPNLQPIGENSPTKYDASGKPVKNQFTATADVSSQTSGYKLSDVLFLTNNLPYAEPLANGHSQQRGAGWIDIEVGNAGRAIADAIRDSIV